MLSKPELILAPDFQADYTSWAIDGEGLFMLVLHDERDRSIASASYTLDQWRQVFINLCQIGGKCLFTEADKGVLT